MREGTVFIIAEIGINHNGSVDIAKKLIKMAKECGCDAVKFQKRVPEIIVSDVNKNTIRETPWGNIKYIDYKKRLELSEKDYDEIDDYCRKLDIPWFASAWDFGSQEFLRKFDLPFNKIASAMLTHKSFLEVVAREQKFTFISTGMSDLENIFDAIGIFKHFDCPFCLMHCVSTYPSEDDECNINMVKVLQDKFDCNVGYSGHERGILPSILAVSLGAKAIERHITLDRTMYGSDQSASLERRGLELLVRDCKSVYKILGSKRKIISERETKVAKKLRYWE